ncbi:Hypothetical predicted protein [Olea europaea subsp. europaea]|uniref:Uncharacterized protein n=1 Tax=Olea europaea subsp. europaea TaxID=158383 RepID=A0A8S0S4J5_OLEEU|nr:Hypothetical predicted protein [Olea europaea subsp. europaea]
MENLRSLVRLGHESFEGNYLSSLASRIFPNSLERQNLTLYEKVMVDVDMGMVVEVDIAATETQPTMRILMEIWKFRIVKVYLEKLIPEGLLKDAVAMVNLVVLVEVFDHRSCFGVTEEVINEGENNLNAEKNSGEEDATHGYKETSTINIEE